MLAVFGYTMLTLIVVGWSLSLFWFFRLWYRFNKREAQRKKDELLRRLG